LTHGEASKEATVNSPKPRPILVNPRTAAEMLAISERSLWKLTFEIDAAIPHLKCGRLTRYRIADLESWLESQTKGGK